MKKSDISFLLLLILALSDFLACRKEEHQLPARAFYYWKNEYKIDAGEDSIISFLGIKKIYLKFFDVTFSDHGVAPVADIIFDSASLYANIEYVPVIFITQSALIHTEANLIDTLAAQIATKTIRMAERTGIHPKEIQLDCDWAEHTHDKYFRLVTVLRQIISTKNMITSCTIRLHQVKYKKESGIPPCDRGMLMFYNMSDWREAETKNSIFDPTEAEKYMHYIKNYPLHLDVALPIFRWAIAYRANAFLGILENVSDDALHSRKIFEAEGVRYRVLRDTFAFGTGLKTGDMIRPESCDARSVADFSKRIFVLLPEENRSFALYHLDRATLSHYTHEDLESLFPH